MHYPSHPDAHQVDLHVPTCFLVSNVASNVAHGCTYSYFLSVFRFHFMILFTLFVLQDQDKFGLGSLRFRV
jgi:hypothetical protein